MAAQNLNAEREEGGEMPGGLLDLEFINDDQDPMHIQVADGMLHHQAPIDVSDEDEDEDEEPASDDSEDQAVSDTHTFSG